MREEDEQVHEEHEEVLADYEAKEEQEEVLADDKAKVEQEEVLADDKAKEQDALESTPSATSSIKRLKSANSSGMESSVFRFKDVNFTVGSGDKKKNILTDVSGVVKFGRVLAIMGPSGAGKTTLINALTLDAPFGIATGSVKLNGIPFTSEIFKEHCFVVQQQDKLWPYLTTRETLRYAAQLYEVVEKQEEDKLVEEIIQKLGLNVCADTTAFRLSGGQRRRLSIGLALVKQPRVLFLDEPTSGLDAASAMNIMEEIVRVAKEEKLIILCTIHQPSTKVYNNFDQIMVMSRGRIAYSGDVKDAVPYFDSTGYPIPVATNPAEFFLDLVNSDFSDEAVVTEILNTWEEKGHGFASSRHSEADDGQEGVVNLQKKSLIPEILVLFRRHFVLITRDPVLYIGRCLVFFAMGTVFALVYLKAREPDQGQSINKFWIAVWLIGIPTQMGVVAVYALNDEFKSLLNETRNGMLSGVSYVIAKTFLVLPIMFLLGLCSLGIPFFVIIDAPGEAFGRIILLFACCMLCFESIAECLSVWFEDPIIGMLQYMNVWFGSFLFGGFLIALDDMYWPFKLFYYLFPYSWYTRSMIYNYFINIEWDPCIASENPGQPICVESGNSEEVLVQFSRIFPLIEPDDSTWFDMIILLVIGCAFKLLYIFGVLHKTSVSSKIIPN